MLPNPGKSIEAIQADLSRKSTSEEEESNDEKVPDYVDKAGRRWHFLCHDKEGEEDLAQFVQENGLVPGNENGKRRKFGCSRPECHFRAVFLKANSGIYTRGEHWHELNSQMTKASRDIPNERIIFSLSKFSKIICRDKEEIFVGQHGKEYSLIRSFETDEEFEEYRRENWLMKRGMDKSYANRIYLCCRRSSQRLSTNCRVFGIYVKRNRSFYQNSEQHNHPMGKEHNDYFSCFLSKYANDKKADYLDRNGQLWQFLRRTKNFNELEKIAKEQMLSFYGSNKKIFYFKCKYAQSFNLKRHPYPPPYCQMRAVFIKTTSSVYVQNKHSHHPAFKLKSYSKYWPRHSRISKYFAKYEEDRHATKDGQNVMENAEQNEPKEEEVDLDEEEDGDEEVRIVKHLQRDYKCLGRMKREGEEGQSRTRTDSDSRADHTIQLDEEEDLAEGQGTSQGTRRRGTFYRYTQRELQRPIKKEEAEAEPAEDAPLPVPQPQQPANIAWLQQFRVARPAKMLLRERKKRINYGE